MDLSYGKGSNNKAKDEYDNYDEKGKPTGDGYGYPYEDGVMSKPAAVVVDGGQRKSSITHFPNVDGSDCYVVRTERVVKVVRPAMTTHYSLKENNDNLGMVNSFLDQFLKEAGMSAAPVLSRSNCRPAWGNRDDSPVKYVEHFQFSPPNIVSVPKYSSWEDTEHQEWSRPSTGTRQNWPSPDESPPRSVTYPQWNHPNHSGGRHDWPSRDDSPPSSRPPPNWPRRYDSPPRSVAHPELNHLNLSDRPNWPRRDGSPPRSMVHHQLSHSNSGVTPNWPRQYDSPPRSMEYPELSHPNSTVRPNWPSGYSSPPRSTRHHGSSHPNSSSGSNWSTQNDSPPKFMTHLELSYPNSSTRPNWPNQHDDSPPKSRYRGSSHSNSGVRSDWSSSDDSPSRPMEYPLLSDHNSSAKPNWPSRVESPSRSMTYVSLSHANTNTKPNWSSQDDSPLRSTDELNLPDCRGTSPLPSKRSGSDVATKTANYNGTGMDSGQRPNWPNRKGHADNRGISPYKSNKDDHDKPKSNGAQSKNTNDHEIPNINTHKIATQREDSYKIPYTDWPAQDDDDDDFKKSGTLGSRTNVINKAGNTKPNYSSGWHKQHNPPPVSSTTNEVSDIMKLVEEAKKTAAYDPNEITPNPPQHAHYSTHVVPAAPWGYYKPVLDSNQALRKYNGIIMPNNTYQGQA